MTRYDPSNRARLARLIKASEALRAAANAFGEALDDAPLDQRGLIVEANEIDDDLVDDLVDRLADRLGVPDDSEERRTVTTRKAARDSLELASRVIAGELTGLVERIVDVVDARATPALEEAERAALATYAVPAPTPTITRGRG